MRYVTQMHQCRDKWREIAPHVLKIEPVGELMLHKLVETESMLRFAQSMSYQINCDRQDRRALESERFLMMGHTRYSFSGGHILEWRMPKQISWIARPNDD
jgi:hypothetical protein